MDLNYYISIILIIGIAQGFLLSIVLLTLKRGNVKANRILAVIILLFTVMLLPHAKVPPGTRPENFYGEYFIHIIFFLLAPLLYFYVKTLTGKLQAIEKKYILHFIPFVTFLIVLIPLMLVNVNSQKRSGITIILTTLVVVQMSLYFYYSLNLLRAHQQNIKESFSYMEKINLNWLKVLLWGQIIIWLFTLASEILHFGSMHYTWMLLSVFIYVTGYFSLKQPKFFLGSHRAEKLK